MFFLCVISFIVILYWPLLISLFYYVICIIQLLNNPYYFILFYILRSISCLSFQSMSIFYTMFTCLSVIFFQRTTTEISAPDILIILLSYLYTMLYNVHFYIE